METLADDGSRTPITISSTASSPKRRASVISISSTEDATPQPNKRNSSIRWEIGTDDPKVGKPNPPSSCYGGSEDDADLLTATRQIELLRSWVDAGIEMAIMETKESVSQGSPPWVTCHLCLVYC